MKLWFLLFPVALLSFGLTGFVRRHALAQRLLDVPNERSSHSLPTPRGGGLAFVVCFLGALPALWALDAVPGRDVLGLLGAGGLVAGVGFLDDRGHVPVSRRLLVHCLAAAWALFCLGDLPPVPLPGLVFYPGPVGFLGAMLLLVWLLNLYNFMDGIDGIAAIEAICVCLGGVLVYVSAVPEGSGWLLPALLAAAVLGFLPWNRPPAKIFMGDVGSGFLGMTLGILSLLAAREAPNLLWCWLILLGVFVLDASLTLLRRILRGERFYEAHRSHAYQYAARRIGAHRPVSLAAGAITLCWLLPIAVLVAGERLAGLLGLFIAYLPLIGLAFHYKAGAGNLQEQQLKAGNDETPIP